MKKMNKLILILLVLVILSCIQGNEIKSDDKDEIIILETQLLSTRNTYWGALFIIKDKKTEKEFYIVINSDSGILMEERK